MVNLGTVVKRLRIERNWSQLMLSRACGISVPYLSDIERGRTFPKYHMVERLATAFGMTVGDLLGFSSKVNQPSYPYLDAFMGKHWDVTVPEFYVMMQQAHHPVTRPKTLEDWEELYDGIRSSKVGTRP